MSGSKSSQQASQPSSATSLWIYNPWLDLIVGCGAWSAPLLLISYLSIASSTRTWAIVFYALALFFNYPHYMATIYRAYHRAEDFHKYRIFTVHITALITLTLILSHYWISILPWIFTIYLTWSPWHYSGQNYGLFMMFARRAGAKPSDNTRRALYSAFVISYLILFLGFHTGTSGDPLFLSLGIPAALSRWEQIVLGIAFVVLTSIGLSQLAKDTDWRKLLPSLTLLSSQFLWFLLPAAISWIKQLEIPQSRYSSGVLAVMHSAQYLWITSFYARREASGDRSHAWKAWAYFGVLIVGGIALFVPGPWLASRLLRHDFTTSFLIFTALVNIHHFILDGAIWKLRDGRIASLLLNSRERVSEAASETGSWLSSGWSWLTGQTSFAYRLRVGAALALLAWGVVDQARYYFALHADNLKDLQRAAALDSFDGPLQARLARQELDQGRVKPAETAYRKAMQLAPADPAPRQGLLRILISQNRLDEAFQVTADSLRYTPKDVSLLVDQGLLAQRLGQTDQAEDSWNRALTIDPEHASAHLYLAIAFDHQGKAREAAIRYQRFLELMAKQAGSGPPDLQHVIAIMLRMADCQAQSSQTDKALQSYESAVRLAAQTKQSKLESLAAVNEAALQGRTGKTSEALRLYEHALELDGSIGDASASAQDWFSYGRFLSDNGYPAQFAYACFVKSQKLQDSLPNAAQQQLRTASISQTAKLVANAMAIRQDPQPTLARALALRY